MWVKHVAGEGRGRRAGAAVARRARLLSMVLLSMGLLSVVPLPGLADSAAAQPAPATPQPASAATPDPWRRMRLEVVRAPGAEACPSKDDFENWFTVLLRGKESPFAEDAKARLVVTLEPDPGGQGYRARNELHAEDGTRVHLREMPPQGDCTDLGENAALSFVIHWKAKTERAAEPAPAGEAPKAPPPAPGPSAGTPPPAPSPSRPEPSRSAEPTSPAAPLPVCKVWIGGYCLVVDIYSFGFSAGALMTLGFTADVGPGAYVGAEIRPIERFSFEVALRGTFPARVVASEPIDPSLPYESPKEPDFSSMTVLFVPCFRYSYFMGCAVGQFGFNVYQTPIDVGLSPNIGGGPRLGVDIPFLERFAVRVWGDLIFQSTSRHRLDNVNLSWTQTPVVGMLGAGLAVNFK